MLKQVKAKNEVRVTRKRLNRSLRILNRKANRYMKPYRNNHETFTQGYRSLLKTDIWKEAKYFLLEYKTLSTSYLICSNCFQIINQNQAILHHMKYNRRKLFKPKYITFLHHKCHEQIHKARKFSLLPWYIKKKIVLYSITFLFLIIVFMLYHFF